MKIRLLDAEGHVVAELVLGQALHHQLLYAPAVHYRGSYYAANMDSAMALDGWCTFTKVPAPMELVDGLTPGVTPCRS